MTIVSAQGNRVETLEFNGRSTPYLDIDRMVVLRVAVDGRAYPPFQLPVTTWEYECATLRERDFWQNVADTALSMGDLQPQLMQYRA